MHYFENEARHKGVRLAGYVPDEKLAVLYNGARGLVTASHYEGFGLPVIEYDGMWRRSACLGYWCP